MKHIKKWTAVILFMITVMLASAVSVNAATKLVNVGVAEQDITFCQDITGDGKADTIKVALSQKVYSFYYKTVTVTVNGTKALTLNADSAFFDVGIRYFSMSKKNNFLQIYTVSEDGWRPDNLIYRYNAKTKKLVKALDLTFASYNHADVVKVTSKTIQVEHRLQPAQTGWIKWNFSYTLKSNGTFKRKSSTATAKSTLTFDCGDGYTKYFRKNQFVAAKTTKFYTSTSLKKTAFTAKTGNVLKLTKIKISGKNIYLQFRKGSKSGWQRIYKNGRSDGGMGWFYGVNRRLAG